MRCLRLFVILTIAVSAQAENPVRTLWLDLQVKREGLPGAHQEFEVARTYTTAHGNQSSTRQVVIDMSQRQWRENAVSGSGSHITIFDSKDIFTTEEGSDEFVRGKRHSKDEAPAPGPYESGNLEWSKAVELKRVPCGIQGRDDQCVLLEIPLKPWTRGTPNNLRRMVQGSERVILDLENGLILSVRTVQNIDDRDGGYQSEVGYKLKRMSYGASLDAQLFRLPSDKMREVKELSPWDATRIKKQLGGKPAPELTLKDIEGKTVSLSALKGKVVLLDFWTTWCPPCRADAPALDKLYKKYGAKDLMILGISVSEEHAIVQKFLKDHPHEFPVALTTENEMPRPYQIGAFPTYIVIDRDGILATAVQGDQGFSDLRGLLKKAHMEVD